MIHTEGFSLHADLIAKLGELEPLAAAENLTFVVTSGARGFRKQALLYVTFKRSPTEAREKYGVVSKPAPMGLTRHHPYFGGCCAAVDLGFPHVEPGSKWHAQQRLGELAESIGLLWGGRWATPDRVHFELTTVEGKPVSTDEEYLKLGGQLDRIAGFAETT
jgi:hypothetical protein